MSLAQEQQINNNANPLTELSDLLKEDMDFVNALIIDKMQSDVPLIPQLAGHLIAAGGKRVRPLLTLACAALFNYDGNRQYRLAASVEFIHTATLLHDDVVDESDQRRGKDTANLIFGNEAAVLVGDFLFSRAFQLMVEDGSIEALRVLSQAAAVITQGEVLQIATSNDIATTENEYLEVVKGKTAELFAAACEVGGLVAERSEDECQALRNYGLYLGIAFQIADDILDYSVSQGKLGKSIGDDFKEGKMTLPIIFALETATDEERTFWKRCFQDNEQTDKDLEHGQQILSQHDALNKSLERARYYGQKAKEALAIIPDSEIKGLLIQLIDFTIERDY